MKKFKYSIELKSGSLFTRFKMFKDTYSILIQFDTLYFYVSQIRVRNGNKLFFDVKSTVKASISESELINNGITFWI